MQRQGELARLGLLGDAGQMSRAGELAGIQGMMGMGDTMQKNMLNQINALMGVGALPRELEQDAQDKAYNEFLRKAGLFESTEGGPLGLTPSLIGSLVNQEKK